MVSPLHIRCNLHITQATTLLKLLLLLFLLMTLSEKRLLSSFRYIKNWSNILRDSYVYEQRHFLCREYLFACPTESCYHRKGSTILLCTIHCEVRQLHRFIRTHEIISQKFFSLLKHYQDQPLLTCQCNKILLPLCYNL